jgi:hypothetical protein
MTAADLRTALHTGVVAFFYVKKDGTLREAIGTTNLASIPNDGHPVGPRRSSPKVVPYWDFVSGGWRALQVTTQVFLKNR